VTKERELGRAIASFHKMVAGLVRRGREAQQRLMGIKQEIDAFSQINDSGPRPSRVGDFFACKPGLDGRRP
jgi:hypothetical protein